MNSYIIVSNRGPVAAKKSQDGQGVTVSRSGGGLASAISPLVHNDLAKWLFPISTDLEIEAFEAGSLTQGDLNLIPIPIAEDIHRAAYNDVSNKILWYLLHGMFPVTRSPKFDTQFYLDWKNYNEFSELIAHAIAKVAPENAKVLLQDYHMFMVPNYLGQLREDISISLFLHTPFASASEFEILPEEVRDQLLGSMSKVAHIGFHAQRWLDNFSEVYLRFTGRSPLPNLHVNPLGTDIDDIVSAASGDAVKQERSKIREIAAGRRIIARVDRMEPSKNILRGIDSVVELFRFYPHLMKSVVHIANCYPSREALEDYTSYAHEVESKIEESNAYLRELASRLGLDLPTDPIYKFTEDNFELSLALLKENDVLLVNPIRDGYNLVASEGPLINERNGGLVLSRNAGIAEVVGEKAKLVNPYDIRETALAMHSILEQSEEVRKSRSVELVEELKKRNPSKWLQMQIAWFA
ncbi:MAG: trehalose-6-phosphate synthase [Actinomycetota bacterium]|nr:trehalose-6-phosphate synthase [Actinomycetota bacterium]